MTVNQFIDECFFSGPIIKIESQGQRCFNLLVKHRPDLAEVCRDSLIDPFYEDKRVNAFVYWLKLVWDVDVKSLSNIPVSLSDLQLRYPL